MLYKKEIKLQGDNNNYCLSQNLKKYTLRDLGFHESKNGKFSLERLLDPSATYNQRFKFKMVISSDLNTFVMKIVTFNGLREVNIFKSKNKDMNVKQLNYILKNLLDRDVIKKCK